MSESAAPPVRRRPLQIRATLRRRKFLDTAALLIADFGYDAVTMTAIADQAGASIGTLYDYFPDKPSIAIALRARYTEEADVFWEGILADHQHWTQAAIAELIVDAALDFAHSRPAYLSLLSAPVAYSRDYDARQPLRQTFVTALQRLNKKLTQERALIGANVIVELIKCLLNARKQTDISERDSMSNDFKQIIKLYLSNVLL